MPRTRRNVPETLAQARLWEMWNRRYKKAGLCYACAAQAAWGHQLGFGSVRPPCTLCTCAVAELPVQKAGGWRGLATAWSSGPVDLAAGPELPSA
jgi:hypothetical protein